MASGRVVGEGLTYGEALALLPRVLDVLAGAELWRLSEGELGEAVAVLARAESRCVAGQVALVGEAVERGVPVSAGQRDGARWLRSLVALTPGAARARAGLATAFGTAARPVAAAAATRAAFAAGEISAGHAGVMVRTMHVLAGVPGLDEQTAAEGQSLLLAAARVVDPAQLGRAGLRLQHCLDPRAGERLARDEDRQQELREVCLVQEGTGMWRLSGHLPPVTGAVLAAALDPLAGPAPAEDGTPDPRTHRQRMADAVGALAELSLAARVGQPGGLPVRHGATTRLILTATLNTLSSAVPPGVGPGAGLGLGLLETGEPGGWQVSPLTTQVLACDAEVVPVLLDPETGRALDVGATVYPFPPRIRKAIEVRDRHCTFGSCTAKPAWCHTHHLTAYRRGGSTSEANGTLLCGWHHRFVHAHAWTGHLLDGHVHWRPPSPLNHPDDPLHPDLAGQTNAHLHHFEQALHQLTRRWHERTRQRAPDADHPRT